MDQPIIRIKLTNSLKVKWTKSLSLQKRPIHYEGEKAQLTSKGAKLTIRAKGTNPLKKGQPIDDYQNEKDQHTHTIRIKGSN